MNDIFMKRYKDTKRRSFASRLVLFEILYVGKLTRLKMKEVIVSSDLPLGALFWMMTVGRHLGVSALWKASSHAGGKYILRAFKFISKS